VNSATGESYLAPYLKAAERFGGGFSSLLWASPKTQRTRFAAIRRAFEPEGKSVLDAGCGRADYLGYLIDRNVQVADYVGLEAVDALAVAAEAKQYPNCRIIRDDFVRNPAALFVGADVIVFSGSLNTMDDAAFYATLKRAYEAAAEAMVFNFLDSPVLAGKEYLSWRQQERVLNFARRLSPRVQIIDDYLQGDCTVFIRKEN
jgi:SAM-dependent methyltransferase